MNDQPALRQGARRDILNMLNRSLLSEHAFNRAFDDGSALLRLELRDTPYAFSIVFDSDRYKTVESPGHYLKGLEEYSHQDVSHCVSRLQSWLSRLEEELFAENPTVLENLRTLLEEHIRSLPSPDSPLSSEEAESAAGQLKNVLQKIATLDADNKKLRSRVERVEHEIDQLQSRAASTPSGLWWRTAAGKVISVAEGVATKVGVNQLSKVITGLLAPPHE